jgi:hypothetical protein
MPPGGWCAMATIGTLTAAIHGTRNATAMLSRTTTSARCLDSARGMRGALSSGNGNGQAGRDTNASWAPYRGASSASRR